MNETGTVEPQPDLAIPALLQLATAGTVSDYLIGRLIGLHERSLRHPDQDSVGDARLEPGETILSLARRSLRHFCAGLVWMFDRHYPERLGDGQVIVDGELFVEGWVSGYTLAAR